MSCAPAHDLRSALDGLQAIGEPLRSYPMPKRHGGAAIMEHYLSRYASPTCSVYCDEQPLVCYRSSEQQGGDVLLGLFGSRRRNAWFVTGDANADASACSKSLVSAIANPVAPQRLSVSSAAKTQRLVARAANLYRDMPVFRLTCDDTAPSITLGLVYAWDQERSVGNCSFHRICVWEDGAVSLWIAPNRHLAQLLSRAIANGSRLPISVNIGLAPHLVIAACCTEPDVAHGVDELSVAGALQKRPVELAPCFTSTAWFIAHAEWVIEGSLGPDTIWEDRSGPDGRSIPEYLGYRRQSARAARLQVDALTRRPHAIYQALTGPGREQSELLGIAQEVTVLGILRTEYAQLAHAVSCCASGGGNLNVVIQCSKQSADDDKRVLHMARAVADAIACVKHVYLVDRDVNAFSPADVLWALSTRFRADVDLTVFGPCPGTSFDPTQSEAYAPGTGTQRAWTTKCIFDCTVPHRQWSRFARAFSLSEGWC